jgi:hypothetical protein
MLTAKVHNGLKPPIIRPLGLEDERLGRTELTEIGFVQ